MQPRLMSILFCIPVLTALWSAAAQADLHDGLVAYFKLDEASGTLAPDASGNGNDGTLIGATLEWMPGYDGGSLGCSVPVDKEVADRLEFPTTGMSATAGTICVWAYLADPQPSTGGRYIFGHTTQPQWNSRIQVYMQDGTSPSRSLDIGLGSTHALKADIKELPMKTWGHVALTWNNGQYAVYVNSEKLAEGTYTDLTAIHPVANFGNDGSNAPYEAFRGRLDEARVYNRALTAAEVKEIFQLPATPRIKAWAPSPADGARDVTFPLFTWKSLDTIRLHNVYLGTDPNLTAAQLVASRLSVNTYFHPQPLVPGTTYYWRVDGIELDLVTIHTGDVWSFLAQPATAYDPIPADGANTVSPTTELLWHAGTAALKHHVYFGEDANAVAQGTAGTDKGIFTDPNYSPGALDTAVTYYWRIDEIGFADAVKTGSVWSFTTVVPIDDFESYNDEDGTDTRIYETWIDGYTDKSSGSTVGNWSPPFAEQTIIHGGLQSMPMDYNNVNTPFYSEVERTWATAQDWTAQATDTLVLYVRGRAGNKAAPVYVTLKDSTNHSATVASPDAALATVTQWVEWKIPLTEFAGVNAARIKTLYIGVGDRANPVAGATGRLYIDDIGLARTPAGQ